MGNVGLMLILWHIAAGNVTANRSNYLQGIDKQILEHRTGLLVIQTEPNWPVEVEQLEHEFWFGTCISSGMLCGKKNDCEKEMYLKILKENFNYAVHENAMKWHNTDKVQGQTDYGCGDAILKWCAENGLKMRGHCVFWANKSFVPAWLKLLDETAQRKAIEARAFGLLTHYRSKINEYDVNNEMIHHSYFADRLGPGIHKDMFRWCRQADADAILYVNDYEVLGGGDLEKYEEHIEWLLAQGVPVDGIGLQGHFHRGVDTERVKRVLDRLSHFNLPIKITEFDIKTLDEKAKAQGLRDVYSICFAHPAVEGILMWGFWAKQSWLRGHKGFEDYTSLWDEDFNPTPAADAYRDLVFNKWWTRWHGKADSKGQCKLRAFYGKHKIKSGRVERKITFSKNERRKTILLGQ